MTENQLTPAQRKARAMRANGLNFREIAEQMKCSRQYAQRLCRIGPPKPKRLITPALVRKINAAVSAGRTYTQIQAELKVSAATIAAAVKGTI